MSIRFIVPGVPVPQGSKMPWGAEASPHVKAWRTHIADEASRLVPNGPITGPVRIEVMFVFPRPKSHYRTGRFSDQLRDDAPHWHTSTPDLDKLQRAIGDALKGVVLRDDSQIAAWGVQKYYGTQPGATIEVREIQ